MSGGKQTASEILPQAAGSCSICIAVQDESRILLVLPQLKLHHQLQDNNATEKTLEAVLTGNQHDLGAQKP